MIERVVGEAVMSTDFHPRWPGTDEHVLVGHVGLVYVNGETPYHSAYGPMWWIGTVDEISQEVIRFGCGEQLPSELVARIPELTAQAMWELENSATDEGFNEWESAADAVAGLRAIGVEPPAVLLAAGGVGDGPLILSYERGEDGQVLNFRAPGLDAGDAGRVKGLL